MKKFWTGLARVFAVIFAILFVVTMLAAILLYSIDTRLLSARTFKSVLVGQQVYTRMPRIIAEQLTISMVFNVCKENPFLCENLRPEFKECVVQAVGQTRFDALAPGAVIPTTLEKELIQPCVEQFLPKASSNAVESGPPEFMKILTVTNWETILTALFPSTELRTMTEDVIDQTFAYINGEQDTVTISLVELKRRFAGQPGLDAMLELIRAQPPCIDMETTMESYEMIKSITDGTPPKVFCRLSEEKLLTVTPNIQVLLTATVAEIPDEKTILSPETGENSRSNGPFGGGLSGGIRAAHMIARFSPEIPLGFLFLVTLLVVRSPKSWLRWWGIPSFFAGLLVVLVAGFSSLLFEKVWLSLLVSRIPSNLSLGLVELVRSLANAVLRKLTIGILTGGLIVGLAGLGLWIGSFFIKVDASSMDTPKL